MVKAVLISYYAKVTSVLNLWALVALALWDRRPRHGYA